MIDNMCFLRLASILKTVAHAAAPSSGGLNGASGTATPNTTSSNGYSSSSSSVSQPQLQYNLGLAFWMLTFEPEIAKGLNKFVTIP